VPHQSPTDSRATYRFLSGFYDLFDLIFFLGGKGNPRSGLIDALGDDRRSILDVCVGTAASTVPVAVHRVTSQMIGIDNSREMLAVARRKVVQKGLANVELTNADAEAMPFGGGSFDTVMVSFALHEFESESRSRVIAEIARVLRPGGRLCVIDFARQEGLVNRAFLKLWAPFEPSCFRAFLDLDWRTDAGAYGLRFVSAAQYSFSNLYVIEKV
jgi:ubiquinone/menaquinone biosynthesis C-methylase UbiE